MTETSTAPSAMLVRVLKTWTRLYCTDHVDHEGDTVPCPGHWVKLEELPDDDT